MLPAAITITTSSGGPGTYTCNAIFSTSSLAKHVNVGDILEDRLGNQYTITTWVGNPADFASGGTLTVTFLTTDTAPATFAAFGDAQIFTEGQVDARPTVRTVGQILTQSTASGQDFTYNITCAWGNVSEAQEAQVGDSVVDANGKEYTISIKDDNDFTSGVIQEVLREGQAPTGGGASLYRATTNLKLYQGNALTDPARTLVRNRDDFNIDVKIKELEDSISAASNTAVQETLSNTSGASIPELGVVATNASGSISNIDVTDEGSVEALRGIAVSAIPDAGSGLIASFGRIENVTTTFAFQDSLFVDKSGAITNIAPEIGVNGFVEGDFIVYLGHVTRNQTTPANKDFFLSPEVRGQL